MFKEIIAEFTIEETTMDYIQCLYYDTLAYKQIMQDILTLKRNFAFNTETYDKFMAEALDANRKFEFAKMAIIQEYAPEVKLESSYLVDIQFNDRIICIYKHVGQEGGCASCQRS